ncbi:InlB B-repeat-containing protein [Lysinibacillus agricola]|uniref:InlB B-repeat-containing protein n=1 Tax=Lysinibacillus agricola TaxID=2590012 RepID=A0ABX7AVN2_9BACI|nr:MULTISPECIES: InlB B-repeat-containing protein [Lysinibacillus]QQP12933.1 InlB B-repeat-containing protein [Lysinibacillus agricola]
MKKASLLLIIIFLVFSQLSISYQAVYAISNSESKIDYSITKEDLLTLDNSDEGIVQPNDHANNNSKEDNEPSMNMEDENTSLDSDEMVNAPPSNSDDDFIIEDYGDRVSIIGWQGGISKDIDIPGEINGKPVVEIRNRAFSDLQLSNVTIPSSVTKIGNEVFSNNQLESLKIPSGVETIGSHAFSNNQLKSIEIPPKVTTIGSHAFSKNQLKKIKIPSNLKTIETGVFSYNKLESVEIPSSVTTIGSYAFLTNQLESVEIPSSVAMIGRSAFSNNQLKSIEIPSSVTTIEAGVFSYNQLKSIEIPSSVTTIGESAFTKNQLTSVKIPSSVTTIGMSAFLANQLESIEIPSSVTTIEANVFSGNQLTNVEIPTSVTTIGNQAFSHNQLTSIEIPPSVTTIGERAFASNQLDFVIFDGANEFHWTYPTPFDFQSKSGKTFLGWFEDEDYTIDWNNSITKPMTIYAKWALTFIVKFDANGGSKVPSQSVEPGEFIKAPFTPVKEGYTFGGWYKDKGLTEAWNFDQDVVKKDITLYAKWSKASYIVTFDANGGSEVSSQTVEYNELVKAPITPKKEGYTFGGWHKDKELTVAWEFVKDVVTQNVTLYAKWTKDHTSGGGSGGSGGSDGGSSNYKITFDSNGGSEVPSQTVGYNDLVKAPTTPVKDGYHFDGWYKETALNNAWDFAKDKVTADITLYAKWTKDYMVTFDSNGGSEIPSQTVPYKALVKAPSDPKKEGYLFIGWYKNKEFTKAWDFAKDVVTEDLTLYARWMKESHGCDITFKDVDQNWAQDMIKEVAERCIIIGYPDGTFRPNDMIQRQHVVLMIDRALQPASIRDAVAFSDVPKSHVNYEQITRLQRAGIVDGSNGAFRPNASITRAEMAKVIVLAFGLTPEGNSTFKDVDPSHWASEYIAALADHNIALGDENGHFRPNENLTRAEFTAIMYRALGL